MLKALGLGVVCLGIILYGLWTPDLGRAELESRYGSSSLHTVEVDGMKVYYKETGPKDAPALLLLHGFGSSLQTWDDWSAQLESVLAPIES